MQEGRVQTQTVVEQMIFRARLAGASSVLGRELRSPALLRKADEHSREVARLSDEICSRAAGEPTRLLP